MFSEWGRTEIVAAPVKFAGAVGVMALTLTLIIIVVTSGNPASGLQAEVAENLSRSGVENPVTAVLLNFRSYDTLLEIAVLFLVVVALAPLSGKVSPTERTLQPSTTADLPAVDPMLRGFAGWLAPVVLVVAGYLLWVGAYAPGGAFQAGALLAGAGILVMLVLRQPLDFTHSAARLALVVGLSVFVLAALALLLTNGALLGYPEAYAAALILVIEAAATVSIAAALLLMFDNLARTPEKAL